LTQTGSSDASKSTERGSRRILVIEDDSRTRRLERFILEEEGFEVVDMQTGEKGLQALEDGDADLVLLDIELPGMDGFGVCQQIRESSSVPIIMVTGEDRDEDKVSGLELGADNYVTKPFNINELAARVKAVLRRYDFVADPAAAQTTTDARTQPAGAGPSAAGVSNEPSPRLA